MAEPRFRCPKCGETVFVIDISENQIHTLDFTKGEEEWELKEVDGIDHLYSAKCENCETRVNRELATVLGLKVAGPEPKSGRGEGE